jgi:hypothetical protein
MMENKEICIIEMYMQRYACDGCNNFALRGCRLSESLATAPALFNANDGKHNLVLVSAHWM